MNPLTHLRRILAAAANWALETKLDARQTRWANVTGEDE